MSTDRSSLVLAGVDFSQVDLSGLYFRVGLALVVLHLGALAAIPGRFLSPRLHKAWRGSLGAFLLLGWASVFVGLTWPELIRGRDWFNLISMIGGLVIAPVGTLVASLAIWLRRGGIGRS